MRKLPENSTPGVCRDVAPASGADNTVAQIVWAFVFACILVFSATTPVQAQTADSLEVATEGMYDLWLFLLGEERLDESAFTDLVPEPGQYTAHDHADPGEAALYHELSHRITERQLGAVPPWLDEGLAEYFERLEVRGQIGFIHSSDSYINELRNGISPILDDLLQADLDSWQQDEAGRLQAEAWSLVYFLLQEKHGRYALQDMVRWTADNPGQLEGMIPALDRAYPGGVPMLEKDWHDWLIVEPQSIAYSK